MKGFGSIARVDMTTSKVTISDPPRDLCRRYLGGRGFGTRAVYEHLKKWRTARSPLAEGNLIAVSAGPLCGTMTPSSSRTTVSVAMSPSTLAFGDGNFGGHFGPELRFAGIDSILITGRALRLSIILVKNQIVRVIESPYLRGLGIKATTDRLKEWYGTTAQVLAIGPAGENKIGIAIPLANYSRAPGGCGTGAVFGSKNLKAIVVIGTRGVTPANPKRFYDLARNAHEHVRSHPIHPLFSKYGTTALTKIHGEQGTLPIRNFQKSTDEEVAQAIQSTGGDAFLERVKKSRGCFNCPVHCSHFYAPEGSPATRGEGVEYEAINAFGARLGCNDLDMILELNSLYNDLGIDVVQAGNILSLWLHLAQDGILHPKYLGYRNIDLDSWGDPHTIRFLATDYAHQRSELAKMFRYGLKSGVVNLARELGRPVEEIRRYTLAIKGMGISSFDPRPLVGGSLAAATSTRGADHLRSLPTLEHYADLYKLNSDRAREDLLIQFDIPIEVLRTLERKRSLESGRYRGKGALVKYCQEAYAVSDAVSCCKFVCSSWRFGIGVTWLAGLMTHLTGERWSAEELLEVGERITATERLIQTREYGMDRSSDQLPDRFFDEDTAAGDHIDRARFNLMLSEYYEECRYTEDGEPSDELVADLDID